MLPFSLSRSPQSEDEVASVSLWERKWAYELSHLGMVWAMGHRQGLGLGQYWDLRAAVRTQICSQTGALKRAWALSLHRAQGSHRTETGQGSHCIQELSPKSLRSLWLCLQVEPCCCLFPQTHHSPSHLRSPQRGCIIGFHQTRQELIGLQSRRPITPTPRVNDS